MTPSPTPQARPELLWLCASNATDENNDTLPEQIFTNITRYHSTENLNHPSADQISQKLIPMSIANLGACSNPDLIAESHFMKGPHIIRFNIPYYWPDQSRVWVLMSASNTYEANKNQKIDIGSIYGYFNNDYSRRRLVNLKLGENIADWTFRGDEEHESRGLYNTAYVNPSLKGTKRVFIGYEQQTTSKGTSLRAAQLFAVELPLPKNSGKINIIDIDPTHPKVGLDVLAVVFMTKNTSIPAMQNQPSYQPLCLTGESSTNIEIRKFYDEVLEIPNNNIFKIGCDNIISDYNLYNQNIISDLSDRIPFLFSSVFSAQLDGGKEGNYSSSITMRIKNQIKATHIYILFSVRNLCNSKNDFSKKSPVIGKIKIQDQEYLLVAGINIRQGRTNHFIDGCANNPSLFTINPPLYQQSNGSNIIVWPGIPVRAKPNERTEGHPAELWLDLARLSLPPKMPKDFTITIENADHQDPDGNRPFIMLYAATLAQNPPEHPDFEP